jgi:phage terminase large subunit-like protein
MATIYVIVCLGGAYTEGYCVANDFDQAQGRVFAAITRIIEASPLLRSSAKLPASKIEFTSTGATITALASNYSGAAGANPTITVFDELWGYTSERSRRLWHEMIPVPTRRVSIRLTVSYAGYEANPNCSKDSIRAAFRASSLPRVFTANQVC